ncbi:MAG: imidazoleglycerol-phosphate dehydratase HisB [Clostridiales bacterium]|nr:imidazoleglycerol-phosphate dehydratase HisB [Clostridiales bacterium]
MNRNAEIKRKTNETDIAMKLGIDGRGSGSIATGIGFLDHMMTLFSKHGLFDLEITAKGDLEIDAHHTVEDIGIVLGQAIREALGDKKSIKRYGSCILPMDEALAMVALDIGGRPFLVFDASFTNDKVGDMETELVEEFFRAVSFNSGMNLHIKVFYGGNNHHIVEAIFKAFGRALDDATRLDARIDGVMSTKGVI